MVTTMNAAWSLLAVNEVNLWAELPALGRFLAATAPIWLFGALIGLLLPRPRWLEASGRSGALFYVTPPGLFLRRAVLFFHGAYIVREVVNYFTLPGATRSFFLASWNWLCGKGFSAPQEKQLMKLQTHKGSATRHRHASLQQSKDIGKLQWYVDEADLQMFKDRVENPLPPPGVGDWEPMMDKDFGNFTYAAWRRKLPGGKTEYKSVTVASNATAEEFMDFYFDDTVRPNWDSMISETEVLENGPGQHRCQVVRWIRSFPFSFISKREYVIGRRMWRENGCLYGITKGIDHPRAVGNPDIVRMDEFHSMWRSRTIPCPHGSHQPACETVLLHHEQFKIPENLARFAVRHGMAGFVKKLGPEVKHFVEERRKRVAPFEADPHAFGVDTVPNPPLQSLPSATTIATMDDTASEASTPRTMRRKSSIHHNKNRGSRRRGGEGAQPRWRGVVGGVVALGVGIAIATATRRQKKARTN